MDYSEDSVVNENIKTYWYRWIVIILYGFSCGINFAQLDQFTIIGDIVKSYYGVDYFLVNLNGLIFVIIFIIFFIPVGHIVENIDLKVSMISCVGLMVMGNCLKLVAASPGAFYLTLLSQTLCAFSQIIFLITPSKIASVWFGAKEVSTACAIGIFGSQIGEGLGSFIPAQMVEHTENKEIIEQNLLTMFQYNAIASVTAFFLTLLFFRSKPPQPPSQSQAVLSQVQDEKMTYLSAVKGLTKNRDFVIVLTSIGLAYGIWLTFNILINQIYVNFFPDDNSGDLGVVLFVSIIFGGCFGTIFFGYILDRSNDFKWITFFVLVANLLSSIGLAIALSISNQLWTFILIPIFGFFSGSMFVIGYEYATETTYPTPEAFGAGIFNVVTCIVAIFYEILLSIIFATLGYAVGGIIIIISLVFATFAILLISPELKRKRANNA